jgi:hypothetical protein
LGSGSRAPQPSLLKSSSCEKQCSAFQAISCPDTLGTNVRREEEEEEEEDDDEGEEQEEQEEEERNGAI